MVHSFNHWHAMKGKVKEFQKREMLFPPFDIWHTWQDTDHQCIQSNPAKIKVFLQHRCLFFCVCVFLLCKRSKTQNLILSTCVFPLHVSLQSEGCVTVLQPSHNWQLKTQLCSAKLSLSWKSCQSRSPAEEALIHPVEALRILNGNVKFFPQLLERFVWRQIQSIEAVKSNTDIIKSIDE